MASKDETKSTGKTEAPAQPEPWYVVDTTAQPDTIQNGVVISGARTHEQFVDGRIKPFVFKAGEPVAMSPATAIKFLRHDAFIRTDKDGNQIEYQRAPKQPEDLGAGERLVLKDNETVARYDELSTVALQQRAAELPGGEQFSGANGKPDRAAMIAFIVQARTALRKANSSSDARPDEFVPEAEIEDEAA